MLSERAAASEAALAAIRSRSAARSAGLGDWVRQSAPDLACQGLGGGGGGGGDVILAMHYWPSLRASSGLPIDHGVEGRAVGVSAWLEW